MTHQQHDHRTVIAAALDDWWITTDPAEPFHATAVAAHLDTYLAGFGYTIRPDTPMPTRRAITTCLLVALTCATSTALTALRGDWGWAATGALAAGLLTYEAIRDLNDRRTAR